MKLDWRDWRVILGTVVVVLIVIGSYFSGRYQSSDSQVKTPSPVVSVPATPLETPSTVIAPQPGSGSETVTEAPRASDASKRKRSIRNSIALLRANQLQAEAEIDRLTNLRNETNMEWARASERLAQELPAKEKAFEIEANRLQKIIDEKLSPNPTAEEYLAIEEWHQLRKLRRENDSIEASQALENSYSQKMTEIEQKTDEWFEELSMIKGMINQLASELEAEGAESD